MKNQKRHVLLVTHQFTPHQSPRTTRWSLIAEEIIKLGHKVTVVTGTKQEVINPNIEIIYIGNKKANNVVQNLREKSNNTEGKSITNKYFYSFLKKIYRFTFKIFAWPDYSMFWLFSIYKNRKKINIDYDLMISVSLPFSSHIAAYIINKKNNKEWIMDIGDPFTLKNDAPENNKILYGYLNKYYENKFYSLADKILFTHEDSMNAHINYFDIDSNKTDIANPISNFKEEIFIKSLNYNYNSLPVKFGYFGIFTKGVRSPKNLINYLKEIKDIEFHWYVNDDSKNEVIINTNESQSIFHPLVNRNEALKKMSDSVHCLLSIGNLNTTQIPSKVIEYISTGKPIIHFTEIENDPVIDIAKDFNNIFVISDKTNKEKLFNELNEFYKNIDTFNKELFVEKYTSNSITKILNLT